MTRTKKLTIAVSTFLVLALAVVSLAFAVPQFGQMIVASVGGSKESAPIQAAAPGCGADQTAWDCPGCPPIGPT